MPTVDLNAVAVFVKVVELKNFRAAARALDVPRSTVSAKVAQLEERLGARLLERTTRAMRLTEAGVEFHRTVAPAIDAIGDAERNVADSQAAPSGTLRITAPFETGQLALGPIAAEYMRRHPAVVVQIELLDRTVDLVEESFDIAIRPGPLADSSLVGRTLTAPLSKRLYASRDYLTRRGRPRVPRDLATHDCLAMTGEKQPSRWPFQVGGRRVRIDLQPRATANSFVILRDLAVAGMGITRLPESLGRPALRAGTLQTVLDEFIGPAASWHAVFPSARHLSPKVRSFVDLLAQQLSVAVAGEQPSVTGARRPRRNRR